MGKDNTGKYNSGDRNSGNWNSGNRNSGGWNSGNWNSGNRNSGGWNSGNWNSGNWNSGYWNSGSWNSGNRNSGSWNSGNWNSGNRNSGNWNSGNWNSGYLNTDTPTVRMFNKDTGLTVGEIDFPDYFYFNLMVWVDEKGMTEKEKEENGGYKVYGGYRRWYGYKEAWRRAWDNATDEDRRKTLELPNWNNDIFLEITGIDVERELKATQGTDVFVEEITVNGKKYRLVE